MHEFLNHKYFQLGLRGGLALALIVAAIFLIYRAWPVVQSLLIAVIISGALYPWVTKLTAFPIGPKNWHMPRFIAAALIYFATFATAGFLIWIGLSTLLPRLDDILNQFPDQTASVREYLGPFRAGQVAEGAQRVASDVLGIPGSGDPNAPAQPAPPQPGPVNAQALALGLFGGLTTLALVLVFTFFLLLDGARFAQWMILTLPRDRRAHARELGIFIRDHISRWVLAQVVYGLLSGLIVSLVMWGLQMPAPHLFGVAAILFAVLPGIGPAMATIPAIFVATNGEVWQLVGVIAFGIAYYIVDSTFISVKIYGEMLRVPMFVILLGLFLGGAWLGIWGALIAAPVAATLQMLIRDYAGREPLPEKESS